MKRTTTVGVPGALKLLIPATDATSATGATSRALPTMRYLKYDDIQAKACIVEMDADDCQTLLAYVSFEAYLKLTRAVPNAEQKASQYGLVKSIVTFSHIYYEYKGE